MEIQAGQRFVFEHADVRDVSFALVRRECQCEWQAAKAHGPEQAPLAHVNRHQAEIGLIEHVNYGAFRVIGQVAGEAVGEAVAVQVVVLFGSAGRQIDQPHAARVAI